MITKYGDIFTTTASAIGHGVNCKGVMGAGIAVLFAKRFGEDMVKDYAVACQKGYLTPGEVHIWHPEDGDQFKILLNIASQNDLGRDAKEAWLTSGLMIAASEADEYGLDRIAIPAMGCGIGGLHLDALKRAIAMAEQAVDKRVEFELWLFEN